MTRWLVATVDEAATRWLLAVLLLLALTVAATTEAAIPGSERQALIDLYNATNGAGWTNHTNWNGAVGTECTWAGVGCDADQTNVLALDLHSNHLTGSIPATLGNLTNLQALRLFSNQLTGSIPTQLGNLTKLQILHVYSNRLSGSIPAILGNLTNLQILYLSYNQLSGPIPTSLGNLTNLEWLILDNNQLSGPIPTSLGNLTNLTYLSLLSNQLTGSIPTQLGNLTKLTFLSLYLNQLTGSIPTQLGNLTRLQGLDLSFNQLSQSIPTQLGKLTNLQDLRLSSNQLTGSIPTQLGNLTGLHALYLGVNRLSGSIPTTLGNLTNLLYLYLNSNQLVGTVPTSLTNLTNLVAVSDFRWNGLYSSNPTVVAFLNGKQTSGDWQSTQTVPVSNLTAGGVTASSVTLTWTPIAYTGDTGGYQVSYATTSGGPYLSGTTSSKSENSWTVSSLSPGTIYYFSLTSVTNPNANNQNIVVSDPSAKVPAQTTQVLVDHFVFSAIANQHANAPFAVTVTAKDGAGQTVAFNGQANLSSTAGRVSPTVITFNNGVATPNVTVFVASINVQLTASFAGASGVSGAFNVVGAGATGTLVGTVWDYNSGTQQTLQGAQVFLSAGGTTLQSATTGADGRYSFANVAAGNWDAWATFDSRSTAQMTVNVPSNGRTGTQDFLIPSPCNPHSLTPVLLIPGILGSTVDGTAVLPTLPKDPPPWNPGYWPSIWDIHPGGLFDRVLLDGYVGWTKLISGLQQQGYQVGCTLFTVPYDWRLRLYTIAQNYLVPAIADAKQKAGSLQVDIIAHSMGGLVARAYVQGLWPPGSPGSPGLTYGQDVRKLAMVGTPNRGSDDAYFLASGGDPDTADHTLDASPAKKLVSLAQYYELNGYPFPLALQISSALYQPAWREFYRQHIPSVWELLPTAPFLNGSSGLRGLVYDYNPDLPWLNSDPSNTIMASSNQGGKVWTKVFAGEAQETLTCLTVGPQAPTRSYYQDGLYEEGYCSGFAGDGTVEVSSAEWSSSVEKASPRKTAKHLELIGAYSDDLISFVSGGATTASVNGSAAQPLAEATAGPTGILSIRVMGQSQPYLVGPQGRGSGLNPSTGKVEQAIPGASVHLNVDGGAVGLADPPDGRYTIQLSGSSASEAALTIQYSDSTATTSETYWLFNHGATLSVTFVLDSNAITKVSVDHTPAPPSALVADFMGSGTLMTALSWHASADSSVTGYNVYSKRTDEPYLSQIGTTTGTNFSTTDAWVVDATIPTRMYAVSAVTADRSESFLSEYARNEDRDYSSTPPRMRRHLPRAATTGAPARAPGNDPNGAVGRITVEYLKKLQ